MLQAVQTKIHVPPFEWSAARNLRDMVKYRATHKGEKGERYLGPSHFHGDQQ